MRIDGSQRGEGGEYALRGTDAGGGTTRVLPPHLQYATLAASVEEDEKLLAELRGEVVLPLALLRPRIVELLNLAKFTHQTSTTVPLDEPLFQPSPPAIVFDAFEPLAVYRVELRLRNNDTCARRLKVLPPQSAVFAIERAQTAAANTKILSEYKYTDTAAS
ncbi:hypothetical protein T492DRAFT_846066 [Pavlovales sp. CCMP2436]|nr:hypothetical protein T492DRAFT_846066 [Pavlovales sp. CCMP2436]